MTENINEKLLDKCIREQKKSLRKSLDNLKEGKSLSYYGKVLRYEILPQSNDFLIKEYELIINKKSNLNSNKRKAIEHIINAAICDYNTEIEKHNSKNQ